RRAWGDERGGRRHHARPTCPRGRRRHDRPVPTAELEARANRPLGASGRVPLVPRTGGGAGLRLRLLGPTGALVVQGRRAAPRRGRRPRRSRLLESPLVQRHAEPGEERPGLRVVDAERAGSAVAVLRPKRDDGNLPGIAGRVRVEDRTAGVAEAGTAAARAVAGRVGHHHVVAAGDVAPKILELVRADETLTNRNLEIRALELHAVPDDREVHVLLAP